MFLTDTLIFYVINCLDFDWFQRIADRLSNEYLGIQSFPSMSTKYTVFSIKMTEKGKDRPDSEKGTLGCVSSKDQDAGYLCAFAF